MKKIIFLSVLALTLQGRGFVSAQKIACGDEHCLGACADNSVWSWGRNDFRQLGDGTAVANRLAPVQVLTGASPCVTYLCNITAVAAGQKHSLFLKSDGTVWGCGWNGVYGKLGVGTTTGSYATPVEVKTGASGCLPTYLCSISAIAAGYWHSLFVKSDGTAWSCGGNAYGQLGDGTTGTNRTSVVQVSGLTGITAAAGGQYHSVFLKNDNTVWACGRNDYGQLGLADLTNGTLVVGNWYTITNYVAGDDFINVGAASNATGQQFIATGTTPTNYSSGSTLHIDRAIFAAQISGLSGITAIAAGESHSLFLKNDNTVWSCGLNYDGQLGQGSITSGPLVVGQMYTIYTNPGSSADFSNVANVMYGSAPSLSTCCFIATGTTPNNYSNLAILNKTSMVPVQISGGVTGVTAIAAGAYHSLFAKNDGTAWACGRGQNGRLGDGTSTNRSSPVQVSVVTGIKAVAAGVEQSLFAKNTGSLWACGVNTYGQVGDGSGITRTTPVLVTPLCAILPVELLSFSATEDKGITKLNWATASEINNDYFSIERSADGKDWNEIGIVKGAGNSSIEKNYTFTDVELPVTIGDLFYYRLKQIDYDGKHEYYGPISVQLTPSDDWELMLQNNPVCNDLQCNLLLPEDENMQAEILDFQGRKLIAETMNGIRGSNFLQFDLNKMEAGIYLIKIYSDKKSVARKFVKL